SRTLIQQSPSKGGRRVTTWPDITASSRTVKRHSAPGARCEFPRPTSRPPLSLPLDTVDGTLICNLSFGIVDLDGTSGSSGHVKQCVSAKDSSIHLLHAVRTLERNMAIRPSELLSEVVRRTAISAIVGFVPASVMVWAAAPQGSEFGEQCIRVY